MIELSLVLVIVGIVAAFAAPALGNWLDRIAVSHAANELAGFYNTARFAAVSRATRVKIEFGSDSLRAVLEGATDSAFLARPGPDRLGVKMRASRPVIRIHPNGLGWGAANTKLVVTKGTAAESLTTSRRGRLKRWR